MTLDKHEIVRRIQKTQQLMGEQDIDLAIITPGINFRYLTDQKAVALERLTALVISQSSQWLLVPYLEFHQAKELHTNLEVLSWQEVENPYQKVMTLLSAAKKIALDEKMPFFHVEKFQKGFKADWISFAAISETLRSDKSQFEMVELQRVSSAINKVHQNIASLNFNKKTEKELANEIKELILIEHETVDFVIVASGSNSANPHHQAGERLIQEGDAVVIDIGGTSVSGYCSDCTRTYAVRTIEKDFEESFNYLLSAQSLGLEAARVGLPAEALDQIVREKLAKNDLAKWFSHRLGHGIGMETHETPYLVKGNAKLLQTGNVFSIEPGFYVPGKWGARIEDIVALTSSGLVNFNDFDHGLRFVS